MAGGTCGMTCRGVESEGAAGGREGATAGAGRETELDWRVLGCADATLLEGATSVGTARGCRSACDVSEERKPIHAISDAASAPAIASGTRYRGGELRDVGMANGNSSAGGC